MDLSDKLQSLQQQIQEIDISDISLDNIGSWPLPIKIVSWVLIFSLVIFAGFKFDISEMQLDLESAEKKEITLKDSFKDKAFQAANLDAYRKQMLEMEESFGALVSQLPSDTEVPGLLEDISNKGVSSGLDFKTIDLQKEQSKEFYIQLPIKIIATGVYHDMGAFVSGVASLPRIVTLTDFVIKAGKGTKKLSSTLELEITANTYRYKDLSKQEKKSKKKKGKKK